MTIESVASVETVIASASEAIHGAAKQEWIASTLPLLAITWKVSNMTPRSRRAFPREFCPKFPAF
jgi:hypothetical protein